MTDKQNSKDFTSINVTTNGVLEANVAPCKKVKLQDVMSFEEIRKLIAQKQKEAKR